jgi:hypothetical protein
MKHIRIPEAATLIDPNTGEPSKQKDAVISFARVWYLAVMGAVKRGAIEVVPAHDLYDRVRSKKPGTWVELTEPEYEAVVPEFKKGDGGALSPEYLMSARDHVRAVVKAPDEIPVALVVVVDDNQAAQ